MSKASSCISFQEVQCVNFKSGDGVKMQVFLEPMPKSGNYFSGKATFLIGDNEIMGTHYWPNLAVELKDYISQSHPNQIISKVFPKLEKYNYSTDIDEIKEHIKLTFSDRIKNMSQQWHHDFNDAFDGWLGMRATTEALFFTNATDKVLNELLGQDWGELEIFPKTKNKDYVLVKRIISEFQENLRDKKTCM